MAQIHIYLNFPGNCREAMTFYKECLGGELNIMTIGESQMAAGTPPEAHNNVMHSTLSKDGWTIMAADMMGPGEARRGNQYGISVVCKSKDEIESLFSKFSQGGQVNHPLKEEFFGTYGDLSDKYGISWMFQMDPQQA